MEKDEELEEDKGLVASLVFAKEKIKDMLFQTFYNADCKLPSRNVNKEFFNGRGVETVYPNDAKANFYLFDDGAFKVYDPLLK